MSRLPRSVSTGLAELLALHTDAELLLLAELVGVAKGDGLRVRKPRDRSAESVPDATSADQQQQQSGSAANGECASMCSPAW